MSTAWIDQLKLDHALRRLQQDQIEALEDIYQMMYAPIFKYTFSMVRNYHQAEDITQEVFLRIERYKNKYSARTNPKAWIYTMTKNLIYSKQKQQKEIALEKEKLHFVIDHQYLQEQTDLSFVKEALDLLSEKERQVITLHIYGGLKHYETAQVLDIPYSKVRSIYTYAIHKIEKNLRGKKYEETH